MNTSTAEQATLLPQEEAKPKGKRGRAQEVAVVSEQHAPAVAQQPETGTGALMRMIERGVADPAFDVAKLEKLLDVKERWEKEEARKAFIAAKAAFKAEAPRIEKNKQVGFESRRTNERTAYRHATLDHIDHLIAPVLAKHGLAHSWKTEQGQGGVITVTCFLTHVQGHSESVTLQGSPDNSGSKNNIQAVGSTVTYLQRYTLLAITGMATADQDDDASGMTFISDEQKEELIDLMRDVGADTVRFLAYMGVDTVDTIPAHRFEEAKEALRNKQQQSRK